MTAQVLISHRAELACRLAELRRMSDHTIVNRPAHKR
jgi:hypothetical protein